MSPSSPICSFPRPSPEGLSFVLHLGESRAPKDPPLFVPYRVRRHEEILSDPPRSLCGLRRERGDDEERAALGGRKPHRSPVGLRVDRDSDALDVYGAHHVLALSCASMALAGEGAERASPGVGVVLIVVGPQDRVLDTVEADLVRGEVAEFHRMEGSCCVTSLRNV